MARDSIDSLSSAGGVRPRLRIDPYRLNSYHRRVGAGRHWRTGDLEPEQAGVAQ